MKRLVLLLPLALLASCGAPLTREGAPPAPQAAAPKAPAVASEAPPPGGPGTRKMAARLAQLLADANPEQHVTVKQDERIGQWRRQLAAACTLEQQTAARYQLGKELLLSGLSEEALSEWAQVQAALDQPGASAPRESVLRLLELQGVASLRLGEQENCIAHHGVDSCIFPIQGGGVHQVSRGSTAAIGFFTRALELEPQDLRLGWLLNLAYMTLGTYPDGVPSRWRIDPAVFAATGDVGRFLDVAPRAKVATVTLSGGAVVDDLDGDGLLDLMVSDWGIDEQLRFHHAVGDGTFEDRTRAAGLTGEVGGLNLVQADYDNDGDVDVLVLRGAWMGNDGQFPNSLLQNQGDGTFEDVTEQAGLLSFHPTQTAAWADFNGDGWLDLFIGNESTPGSDHQCELFRSNGDGTFREVAAEVGLGYRSFVKGVAWGDFDNDGRPDLYLSAYGRPNALFRNDGPCGAAWSFTEVTEQAGVGEPLPSFPTWFFDHDNDGWEDIVVAPFAGFSFDGKSLALVAADYAGLDFDAARTHVYHNNGDGTFRDVAKEQHCDAVLLAMGANFGDIDNDGFPDMYFGTGDPYFGTLVPNRMFRNDGGHDFQDVTTSGGFGHVQKGHGIGFGDLDNDGDQDIFAVMGGSHVGDVYQNALFENPGQGNHWVTLDLIGTTSNRSAIGARVAVTVASPSGRRIIRTTVGSGGSFGASSLRQEIGLGDATAIEQVEIRWPGGERLQQRALGLALDRAYVIREGEAQPRPLELKQYSFSPARD